MTRHRQQFTRGGSAYQLGGVRVEQIDRARRSIAVENLKRVACPKCGLMILPGATRAHDSIVHEED